jgi:hypothetical protein
LAEKPSTALSQELLFELAGPERMTGKASSDFRIFVGSVVVEHDVDQHSRRDLTRDGIEALDERPVPRAQAVLAGGGAVEHA